MNEYFSKLSESLQQIDEMINSLEQLKINSSMKRDFLQRLENAWIEVFAIYDLLSDSEDIHKEEHSWN